MIVLVLIPNGTRTASSWGCSSRVPRLIPQNIHHPLHKYRPLGDSFYSELKNSKTVILDKDEYDVFGDGRVVIKAAPGHSPGHQTLILRLPSTGRVMLSGDLYHYPQERTLKRPPPDTEFSVEQSAASRVRIEEYLRNTKTALWIEHDFVANARLRKSPAYYE